MPIKYLDQKNKSRFFVISKNKIIFILPPIGLGDLVAWLPFMIHAERYLSPVSFDLPEEVAWMLPIYKASKLKHVRLVSLSEALSTNYQNAFILNDERLMIERYASVLSRISTRIGLKKSRYRKDWLTKDISPSFLGRPRHEALRNSRLLRILDAGYKGKILEDCELSLPSDFYPSRIESLPEPYVVFHPYSNQHGREWSVENYLNLAKEFSRMGFSVVFTGSESEKERLVNYHDEIMRHGIKNFAGKTNLNSLLVLLSKAALMIGSSTGPTHLAAALGTKTLGLYPGKKGLGLSRWAPLGQQSVGIKKSVCSKRVCSQIDCSCMNFLSVSLVCKIAIEMLESSSMAGLRARPFLKTLIPSVSVVR